VLNKSYEERNNLFLFKKVEPVFYELHEYDGLDQILEKIGFKKIPSIKEGD
jgi:hypothetical protein